MSDTLESWIESLPANAARLRVRAGARRDPATVETIALASPVDATATADHVYELADDRCPGWSNLRVDALGELTEEGGKSRVVQLATYSEKAEAGSTPAEATAVVALTRALVQSQTEMRRAVGALSLALSQSRQGEREAADAAVTARLDAMQFAMIAERLESALQAGGQIDDPMKTEVANVLRNLARMFVPDGAKTGVDLDDLKAWKERDPDGFKKTMHDVVSDEAMRAAFAEAMAG